MIQTVYGFMTTEELLNFSQLREDRTQIEVELAQRLEIAIMPPSDVAESNDE